MPETAPLNDVETGRGRAAQPTREQRLAAEMERIRAARPSRLAEGRPAIGARQLQQHSPDMDRDGLYSPNTERITVYVQQLTGAKHKVMVIHNKSCPVLVGELKRTVNKRHGGPTPDGMKLLRNNEDGTPGDAFDEDDTQSLADAGILDGATVHMTVQDEVAGKARREAREAATKAHREAREAATKARREELEAKRLAERNAELNAEKRRGRCKKNCFWWMFYMSPFAVIAFLVLLVAYFVSGCGACENDAACNGMFGECVCSGNHTGTFCELRPGEIGDEEAGGVPSWLVIICYAAAIAGCCIIGGGCILERKADIRDSAWHGFFLYLGLFTGGGVFCVAMTVLGVAALVVSYM